MQVIKKRAAHILYLLIGKLSFPPYILNCTTKISAIDPHHTIGFDIQSEFEAMAKKIQNAMSKNIDIFTLIFFSPMYYNPLFPVYNYSLSLIYQFVSLQCYLNLYLEHFLETIIEQLQIYSIYFLIFSISFSHFLAITLHSISFRNA